jgi:hypothetical protein
MFTINNDDVHWMSISSRGLISTILPTGSAGWRFRNRNKKSTKLLFNDTLKSGSRGVSNTLCHHNPDKARTCDPRLRMPIFCPLGHKPKFKPSGGSFSAAGS